MKKQIPEIFPLHDYNLTPEQRLLHAILWRTLKDIFCTTDDPRRSAISFVLSKASTKRTWSYRWICQELSLCPEKFRNHIKEFQNKLHESPFFDLLDGR